MFERPAMGAQGCHVPCVGHNQRGCLCLWSLRAMCLILAWHQASVRVCVLRKCVLVFFYLRFEGVLKHVFVNIEGVCI